MTFADPTLPGVELVLPDLHFIEDRRDDLLSHLFQHQTHHRGQVHGMLSTTSVAPPQLDEFIVADDAPARAEDLARLGWDEIRLMR